MAFKKGQSGNPNGRPRGAQSTSTLEFKEALTNLLNFAAPQMVEWMSKIAEDDPYKAMDMVNKYVEYIHPKLARTESDNKHQHSVISGGWDE